MIFYVTYVNYRRYVKVEITSKRDDEKAADRGRIWWTSIGVQCRGERRGAGRGSGSGSDFFALLSINTRPPDAHRHVRVLFRPDPITLYGHRQVRSWSQTGSELEFGLSSSSLAAAS